MSDSNKFGLNRSIPEDVKRRIRKEAGFGCVICGFAIGTYDHINPEYKDAKSHVPIKMVYLCNNCHLKKTKGMISEETILTAKEKPYCKNKRKCHEAFDIRGTKPHIWIASNLCSAPESLIKIFGEKIIYFESPEEKGGALSIKL